MEKIAKNIRNDIIDMIYYAKSGHPGGSLSIVEILVILYYKKMNLNLDKNSERIDKLVLSKGHGAAALYSVLASKGYIKREDLKTFRKSNGYLEGHPSIKINGVDVSSGSLGQGLSIAAGIALAKKINNDNSNVYCILGDGELEEGQNYEAMMTINKYNLNNLIFFVDYNGLQIDGTIKDVKNVQNIDKKIASFGINTLLCNGHNFKELDKCIDKAKKSNKPTCIICKTIKGKGVSFMENNYKWHGKSLNEEEYNIAKKELEVK